jgi:hypothetical protein
VNALWLAPLLVVTAGTVIVLVLARDAGAAAREVREGIVSLGDVRASLRHLRGELAEVRRGLAERGRK